MNKQQRTKLILPLLSLIFFTSINCMADPGGLSKKDAALLREAINIQTRIGKSIWPEWNASKTPILYKTTGTDYLINHPNPPKSFTQFYDSALKDTVMIRPNTDKYEYRASFPVGGIMSVVVTAPKETDEPCQWILMICHEMFHVYQGTKRIVNPFIGPYADCHELSFPFDYSKTGLQSAIRIEAELLFNIISTPDTGSYTPATIKKVSGNTQEVLSILIADSLHYKYKQWMEWSEGVARYTEYRIAEIAGFKEKYSPSYEFTQEFPNADYTQLYMKRYKNYFSNARFSGEKTHDRIMFYYTGMLKAFVLDKIHPEWKRDYSRKTLDVLMSE